MILSELYQFADVLPASKYMGIAYKSDIHWHPVLDPLYLEGALIKHIVLRPVRFVRYMSMGRSPAIPSIITFGRMV